MQEERDRIIVMSKIDPLTQLKNRRALFEHLKSELQSQKRKRKKSSQEVWFAVVLLKRFKRINAYVGEIGGDTAIQTIGYRLNQCVDQDAGIVARYSGTEFGIAFTGTKNCFHETIQSIRKALGEVILFKGKEIQLDFAIAAAGSNVAGNTVDALRTAVDSTISKIRREHEQALLFYDEALHKETKQRKLLEEQVRSSVIDGEFVSWFQPILFAKGADKINLEALARWPKNGGIITPDKFIPIATETGLWEVLDNQLFLSACNQIRPLIDLNLVQDLSVNVSPIKFAASNFVERLGDQLADINFPPERLVLEITESALVEDTELFRRQIYALHALGIKIAVDDFGTGYSNLRNLIELPIDSVKIDRSLIKSLITDDRATMLVSTLVQWARAINVSVVAEGVETETQAILLRALGCNRLQGYHFGRAMSSKRLVDRIPVLLQQDSNSDLDNEDTWDAA